MDEGYYRQLRLHDIARLVLETEADGTLWSWRDGLLEQCRLLGITPAEMKAEIARQREAR